MASINASRYADWGIGLYGSHLYPKRLNLTDFCAKNWRISSLKILNRTPAMPAFFASTFTNFCGTSYRSIQNAPSIPSERIQYSFHIWLDL